MSILESLLALAAACVPRAGTGRAGHGNPGRRAGLPFSFGFLVAAVQGDPEQPRGIGLLPLPAPALCFPRKLTVGSSWLPCSLRPILCDSA